MSSFLEKAARSARANIKAWKERFPDPANMDRDQPATFLPPDTGRCGIIAEVKRRSPSVGDLMGEADPHRFPALYASGGAEALSVIVEEQHFGGSPELFGEIASRTDLPLLWKDFLVDPYQIRLAAGLGAAAVLLIAGMLSDAEIASYLDVARGEGLRALLEVHDEDELNRAVEAGADLIGVNNRNLVTLQVDVKVSGQLAGKFPEGVQRVSESGIRTPDDVKHMKSLGYRAVLIGESLVTAEDTEGLLRGMVSAGRRNST